MELLQCGANAPLRFLLAHRTAAHTITILAALGVNRLLVDTGVVSFSLWGRLLWLPLLAAEGKLRAARELARRRVVARIEERHASEAAAQAGAPDHVRVPSGSDGPPDGDGRAVSSPPSPSTA